MVKEIYMYGKPVDVDGFVDESKRDYVKVYTRPGVFPKVSLSTLEGYLVVDDFNLEREERLNWFLPQVLIKRKDMKKFAEKHNGEFLSFKK